jgi:selenocysteine lyase/cysteine desulfurase
MTHPNTPASGFDVEVVRREFPIVREVVYLNTGTAGVCPLTVSEKLWESIRAFELNGESPRGWGEAASRMEAARTRLAAFLGAEREEIAFTRNATDGVNLVVEGIQWRDGDEVLLSDQEHPSMLFPWTYLTQRRNVALRRFKVGLSDGETLAAIRAAMSPRTRLLATSHVTSQTGTRVPASDIVRLCHERDVRVLFDGAQAVGQFLIRLGELGADFYTGNLHKWLHGPKGTGFFYVRNDRADELVPTWTGAGTGAFSDETGLTPQPNAFRFEYGTRDFGKYGGIVALFDWFDRLGFENVWAWSRQLTTSLKARLRELPRVRLHSPDSWETSSALTTFSVEGVSAGQFIGELHERHRIRLRGVGEVDGARVSTTLFNTEAELDFLIESLRPYVSS